MCGGLRISSPVCLPGRFMGGEPDFTLFEGPPRPIPPSRPPGTVIAEHISEGVCWYSFGAVADRVVGRFYGAVEVDLDPEMRSGCYYPSPELDRALLPMFIGGALAAFVLAHRADLVMHSSAVNVDGTALAFVGPSGAGKTTLAGIMCAAGYGLVADDMLSISTASGIVTCMGGATELRLRERSRGVAERLGITTATADERLVATPPISESDILPLRLVIVPLLDPAHGQVELRRLPGAESVVSLTEHQRISHWYSAGRRRRQFEAASRIAASVPVLEARIPRDDFSEELAHRLADPSLLSFEADG